MKPWTKTLLVALAVAVPAGAAQADAVEDAIKARKAYMQVVRFNMAPLGAMAKGEAEYDAEQAAIFAGNLNAAAMMKNGAMWPQGSDNAAHPDMTRALPDIWTKWPDIAEKNKAFAAAAAELAAKAGDGKDAMIAAYKEVGKTCGGCHKPYRASKD